jgi:hypothetical protein
VAGFGTSFWLRFFTELILGVKAGATALANPFDQDRSIAALILRDGLTGFDLSGRSHGGGGVVYAFSDHEG